MTSESNNVSRFHVPSFSYLWYQGLHTNTYELSRKNVFSYSSPYWERRCVCSTSPSFELTKLMQFDFPFRTFHHWLWVCCSKPSVIDRNSVHYTIFVVLIQLVLKRSWHEMYIGMSNSTEGPHPSTGFSSVQTLLGTQRVSNAAPSGCYK